MYPVTKGYAEVRARIEGLEKNGHPAEALLASVFVFEKTVKRVLRFSLICRGFTTSHCDTILRKAGFGDLEGLFEVFDKDEKKLSGIISANTWQYVKPAIAMRNKLVHGERVYNHDEYREKIPHLKNAAKELRDDALARLGCDPWAPFPKAIVSKLQWLDVNQPKSSVLTDPIID